jgi:ATP-dependent DNA ligase
VNLQLKPPIPPMEALSVSEIPVGSASQYEPNRNGFRSIAFRDGDAIDLRSKSEKPLGRHFPELIEAAQTLEAKDL